MYQDFGASLYLVIYLLNLLCWLVIPQKNTHHIEVEKATYHSCSCSIRISLKSRTDAKRNMSGSPVKRTALFIVLEAGMILLKISDLFIWRMVKHGAGYFVGVQYLQRRVQRHGMLLEEKHG